MRGGGELCLGDSAAALSHGSYICLSIRISDQFHGRPWRFKWIQVATHMDLGVPKLTSFLICLKSGAHAKCILADYYNLRKKILRNFGKKSFWLGL